MVKSAFLGEEMAGSSGCDYFLYSPLLPPQPAGCVHGTVATFSPLNKYAAHLFTHASGVTGLKEAPYAGTGTINDLE